MNLSQFRIKDRRTVIITRLIIALVVVLVILIVGTVVFKGINGKIKSGNSSIDKDGIVRDEEGNTVTLEAENMSAQVQLLSESYDTFYPFSDYEDGDYPVGVGVTWVSDYDQNGLLEMNFSICTGSGIFTEWQCYEVNEAMDGLNAVEWDSNTYAPDDFTDLLSEDTAYNDSQSWPCYFDAETNIWYYIMSDTVRAGILSNGTSYYAVAKEGNSLEWKELGNVLNENGEDGTTTTYSVGTNTCDTEEDFYEAMREEMSGMNEAQYEILKFEGKNSTDLYTDLWNSASAFKISK